MGRIMSDEFVTEVVRYHRLRQRWKNVGAFACSAVSVIVAYVYFTGPDTWWVGLALPVVLAISVFYFWEARSHRKLADDWSREAAERGLS